MFAHHYHIRPWEMKYLTAVEFDNLVREYERYTKETQREAAGK